MFSIEDLIFSERTNSVWVVTCGGQDIAAVHQGQDYMVLLSNGETHIAANRHAVIELLTDFANSLHAGAA
jgi:hypothetical protein